MLLSGHLFLGVLGFRSTCQKSESAHYFSPGCLLINSLRFVLSPYNVAKSNCLFGCLECGVWREMGGTIRVKGTETVTLPYKCHKIMVLYVGVRVCVWMGIAGLLGWPYYVDNRIFQLLCPTLTFSF